MKPARECLQCVRPARRGSHFCSAACARLHEHEQEREEGRESVEEQTDNEGRLWDGCRRLNLQNSA